MLERVADEAHKPKTHPDEISGCPVQMADGNVIVLLDAKLLRDVKEELQVYQIVRYNGIRLVFGRVP